MNLKFLVLMSCCYLCCKNNNSCTSLISIQDLSGRPHLSYDLQIPTQRVGTYDTQVAYMALFAHLNRSYLVPSLSFCLDGYTVNLLI